MRIRLSSLLISILLGMLITNIGLCEDWSSSKITETIFRKSLNTEGINVGDISEEINTPYISIRNRVDVLFRDWLGLAYNTASGGFRFRIYDYVPAVKSFSKGLPIGQRIWSESNISTNSHVISRRLPRISDCHYSAPSFAWCDSRESAVRSLYIDIRTQLPDFSVLSNSYLFVSEPRSEARSYEREQCKRDRSMVEPVLFVLLGSVVIFSGCHMWLIIGRRRDIRFVWFGFAAILCGWVILYCGLCGIF